MTAPYSSRCLRIILSRLARYILIGPTRERRDDLVSGSAGMLGHERTMCGARARALVRCRWRRGCCVCVPKHAEGRAFVFVARARFRVRSRRHASTASTRRPEAAGRPRSRLPRDTLRADGAERPGEPAGAHSWVNEALRKSAKILDSIHSGSRHQRVEGHGRTTGTTCRTDHSITTTVKGARDLSPLLLRPSPGSGLARSSSR